MQTLPHSALKHPISRCLRRLASPAKQSAITAGEEGGEGPGGDSHIKETGVLVRNFGKNS